PIHTENLYKRKDGSIFTGNLHAWAVRDREGKPLYIEGFVEDITERKLAEEERVRLVTAIEQTAEAVIITDTNWIIGYVNPAFTALAGYDGTEAIGRHLRLLKSGKHDRTFYRGIRETLAGGQAWSGRLTNTKKDGSLFESEVTASPVRNKSGAIINYVAIHRDIARQVKLESELRQAQKMEALGTLAGGIAHDFNNILGVIMGFTELAKFELGKGSPILRKLDEVLKAADRAKELVKQILAFSRRTEQQKIPVPLGLIVKEALRILRSGLPSTIEIKTDVFSKAAVLADPTQLHQVLMNLCTNAAHAMQDQGGVLEVRLTDVLLEGESAASPEGLKPGLYVELTVKDTGCGIDPAIIDSIFDPFFTTKKQGEGTGLGLSVVHGIVKSYEGQIDVESEPGKGTKFTVLIPALKIECVPIKAEDQTLLPRGRERILVVDDEPQLAEAVEQMLINLGYDVVTRTSGMEAIEVLCRQPHEKRFDLVITDMTMPHFTGADLADELRGFQPVVPVILMTGFSNNMDAEKAEDLGIQGFLMKPVTLGQLAKTVREVLDPGVK
ncbi:MAG: PAS domain S-box protein, partial [Syntrophobacteraceae bacterium]